ncbi:MAG: hypothetical protein U0838_00715 [Chloroflexota bacterium]
MSDRDRSQSQTGADLSRLLAAASAAVDAERAAWSPAGRASDPQALRHLHEAMVRLGEVVAEVGRSTQPEPARLPHLEAGVGHER